MISIKIAPEIGRKYQENLERIKGLVKLAVGNSSLESFLYVYQDNNLKVVVEPLKDKVKIGIFIRLTCKNRRFTPFHTLSSLYNL